MSASSTARERRNWLIHLLYVRQEYQECLKIVEETLRASGGLCEYPLYVKGLIKRQQGRIQESLQFFQAACALNPRSPANLKQVGRSLFLLGRFKAALEAYDEADKYAKDDRDLYHSRALCYVQLKQPSDAEDYFQQANSISKHESTYKQLAKLRISQDDFRGAIEVYLEALEHTPDSPDLLTALGLLHLRVGESPKAYEYLTASLKRDPRNPRTLLATGSVLQDHNDGDAALLKYRVAAVVNPHSAVLWNNVGMCFFAKGKHVAAVACLKRSLYLDPFEWIISFNAGLVFLHSGQYASAFQHLSAALNLKPDFAPAFANLGVALARMGDLTNARTAYEKAFALERDHVTLLNLAVSLYNAGHKSEAAEQLRRFEVIFEGLSPILREGDADVCAQRQIMRESMGMHVHNIGLEHPGSPREGKV